jgi:hypothetical protein
MTNPLIDEAALLESASTSAGSGLEARPRKPMKERKLSGIFSLGLRQVKPRFPHAPVALHLHDLIFMFLYLGSDDPKAGFFRGCLALGGQGSKVA